MWNEIRPEDLGEVGQSFFKGLIKANGWIVNRSTDDKAGWDFEIEPPVPLDINYSDQARPVYRVQVKTTKSDEAKVRFTYSNLLNLIRFPGPAFIVLLVFRNNENPSGCYLLHVSKEFSINVLERMRKREVSTKRFRLNKNTKVVVFGAEEKLDEISGEELIKKCQSKVIPSHLKYCEEKSGWLQKLQKEALARHFTLVGDEWSFIKLAYRLIGFDARTKMNVQAFSAPFGVKDPSSKEETTGLEVIIDPIEENLPKTRLRLGTSKHSAKHEFKCVVYSTPRVFQKKFSAKRFKTALFSYVLPPGSREFQLYMEDLHDPNTIAPLVEFHGLLSFQNALRKHRQTYFELDPDEAGNQVSFTIGVTDVEVSEDFDTYFEILDAAYQRLASLGLAFDEFQTYKFFEQIGFFEFFEVIDREFGQSRSLIFPPDEEFSEGANVALFSLAIPFVRRTAIFFGAFYGDVVRLQNDMCKIEYSRTEMLDCLVVSNVEDIRGIALRESLAHKTRLEKSGFIVQV